MTASLLKLPTVSPKTELPYSDFLEFQRTNFMHVNLSAGRILTACYWFCIVVWVSTYTANLAAFLTVKNVAHPIKSVDDIAQTSHQVGVVASTSIQESFATTQYEPHVKIWQRMKAEQTFVRNTSDGILQVRERPSFVFINDGPILEYIANHRPCDLMTGM